MGGSAVGGALWRDEAPRPPSSRACQHPAAVTHDVFVAYASADRAVAESVANILLRAGVSCLPASADEASRWIWDFGVPSTSAAGRAAAASRVVVVIAS